MPSSSELEGLNPAMLTITMCECDVCDECQKFKMIAEVVTRKEEDNVSSQES